MNEGRGLRKNDEKPKVQGNITMKAKGWKVKKDLCVEKGSEIMCKRKRIVNASQSEGAARNEIQGKSQKGEKNSSDGPA